MRKCNNHDIFQILIENTYQIGKRCRYLHQTDFPSRIPRSQKTRNSKGFCEDNLLLQMAEQNSQGRGGTDHAFNSNLRPSQAGIQFIYITNSNADCGSCERPGSQKHWHTIPAKKRMLPERLHPLINYLDLYLSISRRILKSCSCSSGVLAERNS